MTGKSVDVSSLLYNNVTGIATITTSQNHGLSVNNAVNLSGANSDLYNGTLVVTKNVGLTTFFAKIGITTTIPATSGTIRAQIPGFVPQGGNVRLVDENLEEDLFQRMLVSLPLFLLQSLLVLQQFKLVM